MGCTICPCTHCPNCICHQPLRQTVTYMTEQDYKDVKEWLKSCTGCLGAGIVNISGQPEQYGPCPHCGGNGREPDKLKAPK
jgi:rRNA maturation endonuclease Nob1